jgi:hypothetical protein
MNLWRLEWLRLVRTHRPTGLVAVFLLFGFTGPLTARYLEAILRRFGGGVEVRLPTPVPADGMAEYVSNGLQLGLLVVVLVAAAALAFDAQRESAAFLRTRVRGTWQLVLPKVAVNALTAAGAFTLGAAAAWYETVVLLGRLPLTRTMAGIAYLALYLGFAVALTTLAAAWYVAWSAPPWPAWRPCSCSAWSNRWASWPTGCPATWPARCTPWPWAATPPTTCAPPRSRSCWAGSRSRPPPGGSATGTCRNAHQRQPDDTRQARRARTWPASSTPDPQHPRQLLAARAHRELLMATQVHVSCMPAQDRPTARFMLLTAERPGRRPSVTVSGRRASHADQPLAGCHDAKPIVSVLGPLAASGPAQHPPVLHAHEGGSHARGPSRR